MSGFYKLDGHLIGPVNNVYNKDYEFHIENADQYDLPHDGWHYFETEESAKEYFGIEDEEEQV